VDRSGIGLAWSLSENSKEACGKSCDHPANAANNATRMSSPPLSTGKEGAPPCLPSLAVVVPVYNEAATVTEVIRTVLAQPLVQELLVVDDGSTDGAWALLQPLAQSDPRIRLFRHESNQGKGAALRTGFAQATAPIVVVQDADLEYDPAEYHLLAAPILAGKADVVFGSRFIGSSAHRVLYFWHFLGNRVLTTLSNMATNLNLTDMEAGYKAFRREIIQKIRIEEDRFGFEPEITAKVSRLNVRIYEVAISYHGRTYAEGKKAGWRDGLSALRCIVQYNFLQRGPG
jgi:glycosyltransferase involved in cell wall biosynthesis